MMSKGKLVPIKEMPESEDGRRWLFFEEVCSFMMVGPYKDVLEEIKAAFSALSDAGFTRLEFDREYEGGPFLKGYRLETEAERDARLKKAAKAIERKRARLQKQIEKAQKEYEDLL